MWCPPEADTRQTEEAGSVDSYRQDRERPQAEAAGNTAQTERPLTCMHRKPNHNKVILRSQDEHSPKRPNKEHVYLWAPENLVPNAADEGILRAASV